MLIASNRLSNYSSPPPFIVVRIISSAALLALPASSLPLAAVSSAAVAAIRLSSTTAAARPCTRASSSTGSFVVHARQGDERRRSEEDDRRAGGGDDDSDDDDDGVPDVKSGRSAKITDRGSVLSTLFGSSSPAFVLLASSISEREAAAASSICALSIEFSACIASTLLSSSSTCDSRVSIVWESAKEISSRAVIWEQRDEMRRD